MRVYLQEGAFPPPLVLREVPTVEVEVRFVDSRGQPAAGSPAKVWGLIPNEQGQANPFGAHSTVGGDLASQINDPEPQDTADRIDWAMRTAPTTTAGSSSGSRRFARSQSFHIPVG